MKSNLLIFIFLSSWLVSQSSMAATCTPDLNGNLNLSSGSSCTDYLLNNSGAIGGVVSNSGTIEAAALPTINAINILSGRLSTLNNNLSGIISSSLGGDGALSVGFGARVDNILNAGAINGSLYANAIANAGTIGLITNYLTGSISVSGNSGIANGGDISTIVNYGTIAGTNGNAGIYNVGSIGSLENYGIIKLNNLSAGDWSNGIYLVSNGSISTVNNYSSGIISGDVAIELDSNISVGITTLNNFGAIQGLSYGVWVQPSNGITSLNNGGTISGGVAGIANLGSITNLTNTGSITGSTNAGIYNAGTIAFLSNSQGVGNANGPLTYSGVLPTNYNIIIRSASSYGQLSGNSVTGPTNFGIYSGSTITTKLYTGVLQGLTNSNVGATRTGTYSGLNYTLALENGSTTIWDLIFTGGSTADTQKSLVNTSQVLQGTFTLQNSVLANSFSYDCNVFGANNVCISAGGRNTQVQAANGLNNTSALLIAAYRLNQNYRIGAYADQNLSVSNPGGTVNLGNNTPLIGLFGAWNQRLDGTGAELKVSAAYGQKNATVTRAVVGTSEAGTGSSQLNSQGAQVTAKYGFGIMDNVTVSPYVGVRYTQNNMGGYIEATSSSVTAPLTYSALNTNATTALAGVGASYRVIPTVTTFASAGVETDINTSNGTYSATGITGLAPINFNANPVKTRPTATLGAYYDIEKNQRLGITGIYRQEAYQAVSTTTVMATYTVGL